MFALQAQEYFDAGQWPPWLAPMAIAVVVLALGLALAYWLMRDPGSQGPVLVKPPPEAKKDKKEQRNFLRRGGNPVDILISDAEAKALPLAALVIDRSLKGVCVASEVEFDKGSIITIRRADSSTPWVKVEVKNCRLVSPAAYEIGCEFVTVPPASVLMMFG